MKDQYVGDVNDYFKYALLRTLEGHDLALAVAWMLTESDGRSDGGRLSYLDRPEQFRHVDPVLFDALRRTLSGSGRAVRSIELGGILRNATYVSAMLSDGEASRRTYFERVRDVSTGHDLLFFDPDNGLAVPSVRIGRRSSSKYLYPEELRTSYADGLSVVVYQHFPRRPRDRFLQDSLALVESITGCQQAAAITTAHVAFLVAPQRDQATRLFERMNEFDRRARPFAKVISRAGGERTTH